MQAVGSDRIFCIAGEKEKLSMRYEDEGNKTVTDTMR